MAGVQAVEVVDVAVLVGGVVDVGAPLHELAVVAYGVGGYAVEDVLPLKGSKIIWEYDFGDSWIHNIKVTSISDEPCAAEDIQVTSGKGACPPEDVGGVWGYARMLDVLSGKVDDPEEKASFEEWLGLEKGERFDPDEFDPSIANEDIEDLVKLIEEGKDDF